MTRPLVSVYLPTKNRRALLETALDSVRGQTYRDLEIIVVDDASTDDTPDYLRQVVVQDSRVRVIRHEVSRGAPASRNAAIAASRGEFLTGLDDDDAFLSIRIEAFVRMWQMLGQLCVTPSFLYSQEVGVIDGVASISRRKGGATYDDMFDGNKVGNQVFAPKARYEDVGLFDEALPAWQDLDLFMRMLARFGAAYLVDLPTYRFENTPNPGRISSGQAGKLREACSKVSRRHAPGGGLQAQRLYLQMFNGYYKSVPTVSDWLHVTRLGLSVGAFVALVKAHLRTGRLRSHA